MTEVTETEVTETPDDYEAVRRYLLENGYIAPRRLKDGRWIAAMTMLYTFGLFVLPRDGSCWKTRYCYEHLDQAMRDLLTWDGEGDPPGLWIKQKPEDKLNPRWLAENPSRMKLE